MIMCSCGHQFAVVDARAAGGGRPACAVAPPAIDDALGPLGLIGGRIRAGNHCLSLTLIPDPLKALSTMAQQDAMEQVKEVVRQIIKYRFWIAISAAALFGLIAYFVGAGPVREAGQERNRHHQDGGDRGQAVQSAEHPHQRLQADRRREDRDPDTGCQRRLENPVRSPGPIAHLAGDGPGAVPEMGTEMARGCRRGQGHSWPRSTTSRPTKITLTWSTRPSSPSTTRRAKESSSAAPKEVLLRPAVFSDEHVPGLGKIWSAQERLWIQRTLLEVVAQVNKNAKDWNTAIIRQI